MRERIAGRRWWVFGAFVVAVAALGSASPASAVVGDLTYRDCITGETETGPAGSGACAPSDRTGLGGADSGLDRLQADAVSSDGESLYTASVYDDALARFNRDSATGKLTFAA